MDIDRVHTEFVVAFGRHLRRLRERRGLSQERAGKLAGVSRTAVGDMERAKHAVGVEMLSRYATAYGVPIQAVLPPQGQPPAVRVEHHDLAAKGLDVRLRPDGGYGRRVVALRDGDRLAELLVPGTVDVVSVVEAMFDVDLGEPMRTP